MEATFLQSYWWFLVSLLAAILVFLLFVQGGQSLLFDLAKNDDERTLLVNALGRKWEFTFTTLVTFGGAFFASFPLFYATSFGGAYWLWMVLLFCFILQAVSYEFRSKAGNLLGKRTYEVFLFINGLSTFLLGVVVGTLFTGAAFTVDTHRLGNPDMPIVTEWTNAWHGLEALANPRNVLLGLAVFFLSRTLAELYFIQNVDHTTLQHRSRNRLRWDGLCFVLVFLSFLSWTLASSGYVLRPETGVIELVKGVYVHNLLEMPAVGFLLMLGVFAVVFGLVRTLLRPDYRDGIWYAGAGTIATVLALMLLAGWNNTAYYPSTVHPAQSLTLQNSSSSPFTLKVMGYASLFIPVVVAYIFITWKAMNKTPIHMDELKKNGHKY
jgi:cytochrome d ubiquinol oxidase subunit II